jgi:mono/diheme cytochrome c family protein
MVPGPNGPYVLYQQEQVSGLSLSACAGSGYGSPSPFVPGPVRPVFASASANVAQALPAQLTLVVDVAVSADGARVAVAAAGSGLVFVSGEASDPFAGVGQPVAVAWRGQTLVVQSREPAALFLVDPQTSSRPQPIWLSNVSRRSTGHDLFHLSTPSHVACASCHPEAGDDGHVWSLPEGLRRTPTLRGGLSATAPFHWDGEMTSMGKLVDEIMVKRMGGEAQSPNRVAALLGWLDSVPKQAAPAVDAEAAARGEALFEDSVVGCAACHAGALGTNNSTVSVGTGQALQVPRLVELASRAPYFHDGRVPTLEARFGAAGGSAHGDVSKLTPAQVADLIAYLRTR